MSLHSSFNEFDYHYDFLCCHFSLILMSCSVLWLIFYFVLFKYGQACNVWMKIFLFQNKLLNFGFKKNRKCAIRVAKTKVLISFTVTAKLICVFVFASAKIRFSHDTAHMV